MFLNMIIDIYLQYSAIDSDNGYIRKWNNNDSTNFLRSTGAWCKWITFACGQYLVVNWFCKWHGQ